MSNTKKYWWKSEEDSTVCQRRQQQGDVCPNCGLGPLAYNGLFVLTCAQCHYVAENGAFS